MIRKTLFLFIASLTSLSAQKFEVGGGAGITHYKGDLYPTFRVFNFNAGTNILVRYNLNKAVSAKAGAMIGFLSADEKRSGSYVGQSRGLKFNNLLIEWNGQVEYNFLNFRSADRTNKSWTPYLFGGVGMYQMPFKKFTSPDGSTLEITGEYSPKYNIPFGVGFKKVWKSQWNFGVEFGTRVLLNRKYSDNLDGFGYGKGGGAQSYYTIPVYQIGEPMYKHYPATLQPDKYFYTNFYISYVFYKLYCPPGK